MPHTSFRRRSGKENVAYLFSDRSRALARAYVLKKVRRYSFLNSIQMKGKRHSPFFDIKNLFFLW